MSLLTQNNWNKEKRVTNVRKRLLIGDNMLEQYRPENMISAL